MNFVIFKIICLFYKSLLSFFFYILPFLQCTVDFFSIEDILTCHTWKSTWANNKMNHELICTLKPVKFWSSFSTNLDRISIQSTTENMIQCMFPSATVIRVFGVGCIEMYLNWEYISESAASLSAVCRWGFCDEPLERWHFNHLPRSVALLPHVP